MTERKPIRSEEELVEAFDKLFDEIPSPQTQEEIDEYIQEAGINPDEFGAQIKEIASKALADSPLNWRNRASSEIEGARAQLESIGEIENKDRNNLLSMIERVKEKLFATGLQSAPIQYRNRAELSDEDLVSLLQELVYIADQSNIEIDFGE